MLDLNEKDCFRALLNITLPIDLSKEFYSWQDAVLEEEKNERECVDVESIPFFCNRLCLWQGDITTIKADGIVNAANEKLLGCFQPLHSCIDNAIHSKAGLQLRRDLMQIMNRQGHDEEPGNAKITLGYHLPCRYILHTVGPKVNNGIPTDHDRKTLRQCYISCLTLAEKYHLQNIVFCSISTGVYGYPIREASQIAVSTVQTYLSQHPDTSIGKVVFNVFSKRDYEEYVTAIQKMV